MHPRMPVGASPTCKYKRRPTEALSAVVRVCPFFRWMHAEAIGGSGRGPASTDQSREPRAERKLRKIEQREAGPARSNASTQIVGITVTVQGRWNHLSFPDKVNEYILCGAAPQLLTTGTQAEEGPPRAPKGRAASCLLENADTREPLAQRVPAVPSYAIKPRRRKNAEVCTRRNPPRRCFPRKGVTFDGGPLRVHRAHGRVGGVEPVFNYGVVISVSATRCVVRSAYVITRIVWYTFSNKEGGSELTHNNAASLSVATENREKKEDKNKTTETEEGSTRETPPNGRTADYLRYLAQLSTRVLETAEEKKMSAEIAQQLREAPRAYTDRHAEKRSRSFLESRESAFPLNLPPQSFIRGSDDRASDNENSRDTHETTPRVAFRIKRSGKGNAHSRAGTVKKLQQGKRPYKKASHLR
ncbi:hypothetical protein HPB51_013852 [Rhipicephalus microplus]|uniref:Uncharacterized protein n=1 Tax=Rhipicephalus microplus TaxID=6941 RepID=A0A9J6F512_RHIMP|nr:hypothetical protein HPB51_013852 [Rhipicephalus microplus]